jgi:hypothetical protein
MKAMDIKHAIHESIENIDDEDFLEIIRELVSHKYQVSGKPEFSETDLKEIHEARDQINKGNFKTENEMDELVSKWANE